jgi:hypothetical protein
LAVGCFGGHGGELTVFVYACQRGSFPKRPMEANTLIFLPLTLAIGLRFVGTVPLVLRCHIEQRRPLATGSRGS